MSIGIWRLSSWKVATALLRGILVSVVKPLRPLLGSNHQILGPHADCGRYPVMRRLGDDVDDSVHGVAAPDSTAGTADDFDSIDVLHHDIA